MLTHAVYEKHSRLFGPRLIVNSLFIGNPYKIVILECFPRSHMLCKHVHLQMTIVGSFSHSHMLYRHAWEEPVRHFYFRLDSFWAPLMTLVENTAWGPPCGYPPENSPEHRSSWRSPWDRQKLPSGPPDSLWRSFLRPLPERTLQIPSLRTPWGTSWDPRYRKTTVLFFIF